MSKVTELKQVDRIKGVTFLYADCNNRLIHDALEKLDNSSVFDGADLSRFNKIKASYDKHSKIVQQLFKKLIDKHAIKEPVLDQDKKQVLDGSGKPVMQPKTVPTGRGTVDFVFKNKKAFTTDYKLLMTQEFKVDAYRLLTNDFVKAGLTPKEVRALAKIISDIDPELIDDSLPADLEDENDASDAQESSSEASNLNSDASTEVPPTHATPGPDSSVSAH